MGRAVRATILIKVICSIAQLNQEAKGSSSGCLNKSSEMHMLWQNRLNQSKGQGMVEGLTSSNWSWRANAGRGERERDLSDESDSKSGESSSKCNLDRAIVPTEKSSSYPCEHKSG